uniref:Uncharacterized protein n=1 Tax=Rhizophora mucronata TaxID=61149 RepID=A0A2P2P4Z4_RHIMU
MLMSMASARRYFV